MAVKTPDMISRTVFFLSFLSLSGMLLFLSGGMAAAVALLSLILLIPKVKIPVIKDIRTGSWIIAAFFSFVILLSAKQAAGDGPLTVYCITDLMAIPALALSAHFVSGALPESASAPKENNERLTIKETVILLSGSILIISLLSSSSPLYPYNYWDDANLFFTLGRSIRHGMVPDRVVYEQKGPVLFFMHALAALISEKSFTGVFFIEIIENFFFCLFAWKTVKLFVNPSSLCIAAVPALLSVLCCLSSFYFGDSAEEMCLPLLSAIMYMGLKTVYRDKPFTMKYALICGILSGFVFWLKYTMCGMILGMALFLLIDHIARRRIRDLLKIIAVFLSGILIFSAPVLLYFAVNGAIDDLLVNYFYNNIFRYTQLTENSEVFLINVPVIGTVMRIMSSFSWDLWHMLPGAVIIFVSVSAFRKRSKRISLMILSCLFFAGIGIYIGKTVLYYYFHLLMFISPVALAVFVCVIDRISSVLRSKTRLAGMASLAVIVLILLVNIFSSPNLFFMMSTSKEDLPQYKLSQNMNCTADTRILYYDLMDNGLYTFTGTLPRNKYFSYWNISNEMPEIREEQHALIEDGYFDYIVAASPDYAFEGYEVISSEHFQFLGIYKKLVADDMYLYGRVEG